MKFLTSSKQNSVKNSKAFWGEDSLKFSQQTTTTQIFINRQMTEDLKNVRTSCDITNHRSSLNDDLE